MTELVPAILTNDISDFRKKYSDLAGIGHYFSKLHIDFIDGEFLPNKSIMPKDLSFLKTPFVLMGHLMAFHPEQYFEDLKQNGFTWAVIQYEAFQTDIEILDVISQGKRIGLRMGLAISPETPLSKAVRAIREVELVQIMGVHPGAQGRPFEVSSLAKVAELKELSRNVIISVDGGMRLGIAEKCARAGADVLIVGSAILHATHPKEALEAFKRELELL